MGAMPVRGRYAPSPTGEIHLGNASSALLAWLSVRARGGTFVMRMEDLDRNRVRPGLDRRILDDLRWLGLDWDEGPDLGGRHAPYTQAARGERYDAAFAKLVGAGCLYRCFCSRKDIAAAASAPQAPGDEVRYPGTCRTLDPGESDRRAENGDRFAWRFRVASSASVEFEDLVHGRWGTGQPAPGDFVILRSDGVPAYQLAVVVDDAEMRINEVVRGDDLLTSTVRQLLLYEALRWKPPAFGHVPLLMGTDGARLSKRHEGITLAELRSAGWSAEAVVGRLAHVLGLRSRPESIAASGLVDGFSLADVRPVPEGIVVDPGSWEV